MSSFRYIVGIDLGTSSCALSYVDRYAENPQSRSLAITQWHQQGLMESHTLPSFCYIPKSKEAEQFKIPFSSFSEPYVVGILAQERLATHTHLVIHSAKSWLCHGGVDREAKILPWHSDVLIGEKRLSPVFVSSLYLRHLKDVWDKNIANGREEFRLDKQKIIVTVPASFDETASFLTLEASKLAGLGPDVTLCEEPQAAFHYWFAQHSQTLNKDANILVVDIGGGTTDFCLFKSSWDASKNNLSLQRVAVSDHILLGGDNIDLALAHLAEKKMQEQGFEKLSGEKWAQLVFECRRLKEKSLSDDLSISRNYYVSLSLSSGNKLIANTCTLSFTSEEIFQTVLEGFFPFCDRDSRPEQKIALKEWGLPYAQESAVSKHLAAFLKGKHVDYVLYTGGTLVPAFLRERLSEIIARWQNKDAIVLENDALELAVSRGASIFGYKIAHKDEQVLSGYPRSLYIKVMHAEKQKPMALCLVPKGYDGTQTLRVSTPGLHALLGKLARFELFSALDRPEDKAGSFTDIERLKAVCVLQTRLGELSKKQSKATPIFLEMRLAASGLLELYCVPESSQNKEVYKLNFAFTDQNVESSSSLALPFTQKTKQALECIDRFYGKEKLLVKQNPMTLPTDLEQILGLPRKDWDLATLRSLWPALKEGIHRRNRSEQHELAWLNLAGYVLRPGYGAENDALRCRELQPLFTQGPAYATSTKVKTQWWIFWRRIAGALDRNTQDTIFSKLYPLIKKDDCSPEIFLLLGSLERVDMQKRVALGQWLSSDIVSTSLHRDQKLWALTRIANRLPLYGGAECIVRPHFVLPWLDKLWGLDLSKNKNLVNFYTNACRLIEDREFDIPESYRMKVIEHLKKVGVHTDLLQTYIPQDSQTMTLLMGDALPVGLQIC